jgi:hypothetical protein
MSFAKTVSDLCGLRRSSVYRTKNQSCSGYGRSSSGANVRIIFFQESRINKKSAFTLVEGFAVQTAACVKIPQKSFHIADIFMQIN